MHKVKLKGFLSISTLKIIAVITMTMDHYASYFIRSRFSPEYILLRTIGRLAMPIFCFALVQGFINTRNIKRYLTRMGITMLVSEVVYDWIEHRSFFYAGSQSIMVTLFLSLAMLCVLKYVADRFNDVKLSLPLSILVIILFGLFNLALKGDYGVFGVAVVAIFYIFRNNKLWMLICFIAASVVYSFSGIPDTTQIFGILALIPILLYNGKKGLRLKYLFYIYYPLHLLVMSAFLTVPLCGAGVVSMSNRKAAEMSVEEYNIKHCPLTQAPYMDLGARLEELNEEIVTIPYVIENSDVEENSYIYDGNEYFLTKNYGILLTIDGKSIQLSAGDVVGLNVTISGGDGVMMGSESTGTKELELSIIKDDEVISQTEFTNVITRCECQSEITEDGEYIFLVKNLSDEKVLIMNFELTIN